MSIACSPSSNKEKNHSNPNGMTAAAAVSENQQFHQQGHKKSPRRRSTRRLNADCRRQQNDEAAVSSILPPNKQTENTDFEVRIFIDICWIDLFNMKI